ncbi:NUDIX hydrolase [soil metagenome]
MTQTGHGFADEPVTDPDRYPTLSSRTVFEGKVIALRQDEVEMSDGAAAHRDVVVHPGAVGVIALDHEDRVVMIRQYRHPVRRYLWELPAGIIDVVDEPLLKTARRELAEEVGLQAGRWDRLLDFFASPGGSTEQVTVFLARELSGVARPEGFVIAAEELDLEVRRIPLVEALGAVHSGRIGNSIAVAGILAAVTAKAANWQTLRPPT